VLTNKLKVFIIICENYFQNKYSKKQQQIVIFCTFTERPKQIFNMKKSSIVTCFCLLLFVPFVLNAQKVGLVLSGGGAKGITHIGVIKALEENNIPIDYVAGTSMGAIVAGMYAMGMSPNEMIAILKSEDFSHWSTGEIESDYNYYYRNPDPKPKFAEMSFKINRLDTFDIRTNILPTNLISPRQMNYAFIPLCSQANALAHGDFDKLFVPFRCVASDIHNKEAVVCRYGELGDAIRASMTFPFMFKPIQIDKKLLFDGGIFNNFPVDVMRSDFKPDFIIGSAVANNPKKPDENDIVMQIENMIMAKTDYQIKKKEGILVHFQMNNVNMFDFSRVDELVKLGYDSIMQHMNEIKARVKNRVSIEEIQTRRQQFVHRFPELKFQRVVVDGVDSLQKKYIEQVFHSRNEIFNLKEMKEAYFKLISDDKILEVIPHARFNSATGNFDLLLNVKTQDRIKVALGGNISSSTSNQVYFGLSYQNLTEFAQTATIDAQFGKLYNGVALGTRIEIPSQQSWYMKLALVLHKFDYFKDNQLFYTDYALASFKQMEAYSKISMGLPLNMNSKIELGLGCGALNDYYMQNDEVAMSAKEEDKSQFLLGTAFGRIEFYTLNNLMYPTSGTNFSTSLQLIGGEESFKSVTSPQANLTDKMDVWIQLRSKYDRYFIMSKHFTIGTSGEIALTTRKLLNNYVTTIIQAPAFRPTAYSKTVFNPAFSANEYAVVGLKPIYNFNKQLHVRSEAYCFVPYRSINKADDNSAYYSLPLKSAKFMAETTLVYNFKIASAGMFLNYSNSAASNWNFGINIGFLLFNSKFIE
jgi:NTE family protein